MSLGWRDRLTLDDLHRRQAQIAAGVVPDLAEQFLCFEWKPDTARALLLRVTFPLLLKGKEQLRPATVAEG